MFAAPIVAAVLALLAPLAGLWVAAHSSSIKEDTARVVPSPDWTFLGVHADVWVFILMLGTLGFGFALNKWAEAVGTRDRQVRLEDSIRVVATLGLERAAAQFKASVATSYNLSLSVFRQDVTKAEIATAIRDVLTMLSNFIKELDQAPTFASYRCSIFLMHTELDKLTPVRRAELLDEAKKIFPKEWPAQLTGILELRPELSTAPTNHVRILPIPLEAEISVKGVMRPTVWPGAPYSAAKREYQVFRSIADIDEWCVKANYADSLRERIAEYFATGEGASVKSFATVPVEIGSQMVGVISIERSTPGILPAERHQIFLSIATPLILYTGQLLVKYRSL